MRNKVKYITSAKRIKKNKQDENNFVSIILLCDTPGYRMKSYGPPALININNVKLIDIQISSIKSVFQNFEVIICDGYDVDKVYKYIKTKYSSLNIRIVENQIFNQTNSCESVRIALNNTCNDKIFICEGSLLFKSSIFEDINLKKSFTFIEPGLSCENLDVGVNVNENNIVEHFSFGGFNPWSEITYLSNHEIIDSLRKILSDQSYKNKFIFEALNDLIKLNHEFKYIINHSGIKKVNNIKTYHLIKEIV